MSEVPGATTVASTTVQTPNTDTAVELTGAALSQLQPSGTPDEQAIALRDAMRVLFPEAVALVSAARQGFMRER